MTTTPTTGKQAAIQPCGSWRVVAILEGYEYEKRWCSRTSGPCPYVGTMESREQEQTLVNHHCAAPESWYGVESA